MGAGLDDGLRDQGCSSVLPSPAGVIQELGDDHQVSKGWGSFSEGLSLWQKPPCCPDANAVTGTDVFM